MRGYIFYPKIKIFIEKRKPIFDTIKILCIVYLTLFPRNSHYPQYYLSLTHAHAHTHTHTHTHTRNVKEKKDSHFTAVENT